MTRFSQLRYSNGQCEVFLETCFGRAMPSSVLFYSFACVCVLWMPAKLFVWGPLCKASAGLGAAIKMPLKRRQHVFLFGLPETHHQTTSIGIREAIRDAIGWPTFHVLTLYFPAYIFICLNCRLRKLTPLSPVVVLWKYYLTIDIFLCRL